MIHTRGGRPFFLPFSDLLRSTIPISSALGPLQASDPQTPPARATIASLNNNATTGMFRRVAVRRGKGNSCEGPEGRQLERHQEGLQGLVFRALEGRWAMNGVDEAGQI